jgi:hypothetical protein
VRAIRTAAEVASAPVLRKLHALGAGNQRVQPLGELHFAPARQRTDVAFDRRVHDGARDAWLGVAERDGAERHRAVNIAGAVDVDDATAARREQVRGKSGIGVVAPERDGPLAPRRRTRGITASARSRQLRRLASSGDASSRSVASGCASASSSAVGASVSRGSGGAVSRPRPKNFENAMIEREEHA